ncbi:27924_t:CDS:2, partial [Dentiscutata erythropus]
PTQPQPETLVETQLEELVEDIEAFRVIAEEYFLKESTKHEALLQQIIQKFGREISWVSQIKDNMENETRNDNKLEPQSMDLDEDHLIKILSWGESAHGLEFKENINNDQLSDISLDQDEWHKLLILPINRNIMTSRKSRNIHHMKN